MLISWLEGCQEWGVDKRGTWRMLMVPNKRFGGKHCWGQMWKSCPCDLPSSSPASPSCFQPASRHARPQLDPDWLNPTLPPWYWLGQVITALPLYGYCTASNKGWLKRVIEKAHCWEGSLILPWKLRQRLIKTNHLVGYTITYNL